MAYETEWLNVLEFDSVLRLVARYCDTEGGRNAVSKLSPHGTEYELRQTQKRLAETMELLTTTKFPGLSGYEPPRDIVRQCRISSVISPNVFRRLYDNLLKARKATQFVMSRSEKFRHVATMLSKLPDLSELERDIDNVIDKRDKIRDTASPEISRIRNRIRQLDEQIHSTLKSLARGQDIRRMLQFPEPTISGERYVLAVKSEHRSRFDGIAHYSSDSGQTTFMEPYAVVGKTNDLMREKSAEKAEKKRLLAQLAKSVIRHSEQLDQYFVIIDRLDVLIGSARFGASFNGVVPDISFDMVLKLEEAKHPLLLDTIRRETEKTGKQRDVVPLTVTLASEFSLLVITGPNTGGKTVALKTIGLLSVMALSGLPVTAQKAEVPMYCSVFADIGDEQSIEQNLSTFSSHITRIARILEESDENTLVLLDELGSGTDPSEGAALGTAIIEDLSERKVPTVVTTHIGQLKQIAYSDRNVQNAGMEFDTETLRPLYRLTVGEPGESKAVMISSRLGMPQRIIERSKALLEVDDVEQEKLWKDLQKVRREIEAEREQVREQQSEVLDSRRKVGQLQQRLQEKLEQIEREQQEKAPAFEAGDEVYIRAMRRNGVVKSIDKRGVAKINVKGRELSIPVEELEEGR